jgi:hypothetical protein
MHTDQHRIISASKIMNTPCDIRLRQRKPPSSPAKHRSASMCLSHPTTSTGTLLAVAGVLTGCTHCAESIAPCQVNQQICEVDRVREYLCVADPALPISICVIQGLCPSTEGCCTLFGGIRGCCSSSTNITEGEAWPVVYASSPTCIRP